ncbi:hypothetical protein JY651_38010 [Pyxidicoccus parkwayensis]|uniref:Uncharacterized protein n=1 Tax=Pyxidicoccus parkwayensis TaxID=2813578 RepID=A0ABX7NQ39_9BACT|nr:hypothetical protein [Pyxidicoccus parkwaysis]QSQ20969.1 hypothetical protein JY651_38010 [Pyxidicoccus parkwaysis]
MSTLTLPTEAVVIAYDEKDGLGTLRTSQGVEVRFGASACTDFVPEQGMSVWLVETKPDPLGRGERAKVVNRTGHVEKDRLAQIWEEHAASDACYEREVALLEALGLPGEAIEPSDYETLSPEQRVRLAEGVMELRRTSRLFEEAFTALTELDPTLLHPYLGELSHQHEVEALAWTDAPSSALAPLMDALRMDWHPQQYVSVKDPVAAAALALARSGRDGALRVLEAWVGALDEGARLEALTWLRRADVVPRTSGKLVRNFTPACLEVLPEEPREDEAPVARGTLWRPIPDATCMKCGNSLVDALHLDGDGAALGLPWPARLPTCLTCLSEGGTVHVELSPDGALRSMGADRTSKFPQQPTAPRTQTLDFVPGRTWRSIMMSDGERLHRLGGAPSWVEYPEAPPCPRCREPMHAVGQVRDDDCLFSDTGMLYGVACEGCRIVTTFSQ